MAAKSGKSKKITQRKLTALLAVNGAVKIQSNLAVRSTLEKN